MKKLAHATRGLLFGAPLALLGGISAISFLLTREASPSTTGPPPPPISAGSILFVLKGDADPPSGASDAASPGGVASSVEAALRRTGPPVADARFMWDVLVHGGAPLNTGKIDTPIPSVWPLELRPEWETARALCVVKAGPPPYGMANLASYLCGLKIAPVLWQKWLDKIQAEEVVIVDVSRTNPNDPNHDTWNVEVSAYQPSSIDEHWLFKGELPPQAIPEVAADLAVRAMGGEGRIIRRTIEREMPDSPQYHSAPAVAIPNSGIPVRSKP